MIDFFDRAIPDANLQGNKGANLVVMTGLDLPVPPGFVIPIAVFKEYQQTGQLPLAEIEAALKSLAKKTGKVFGKDPSPKEQALYVSVRSSAPVSMPGMMDTVLNLKDRAEIMAAIERIFSSWNNARAIEYRRLNNISPELGTAAVVQAMVFGNRNERSGTGVVFSRNPTTGEPGLFGEYLAKAQGEDIVSGQRTPSPVKLLQQDMPAIYAELEEKVEALEAHFREMQDIEFTVEDGRLFILQTRSGKRSGQAAIRIAVDLSKEGLISREEAILRVRPDDLKAVLYKRIESPEKYTPAARGLNAAPGAAFGRVVFHPIDAVAYAKKNEKVILVRIETSPDDIQGISAADGILTSRGGLTSHAAIVTRAMGKPCVCGCEALKIDLKKELFEVNGRVIRKGEIITVDGTTGAVYLQALPLVESEVTREFSEVLSWADEFREMGVWANADTPEMVVQALKFGAEGVGLCRTERQFNTPERLVLIREFIMAEDARARTEAIKNLEKLQKEDFAAIFAAMKGKPVIVRLLDLPLHEFLPREEETADPKVRQKIRDLEEVNPMLGHRGVRVGISYPEIYCMQIDSIVEARELTGANVGIMIPQVITVQELLIIKQYCRSLNVRFGVMIETVRACMRAGKLAQEADFFSFGTNDLTQATFSFSREDAEKKFLTTYLEKGILQDNPFAVIDVKGVGRLMQTAIEWGRKEKPDLNVGVCGEHAGEPRSIRFFHNIGVTYLSVSAFKIPVARLVAAQVEIEQAKK
ncbi:MAG: pyruvate, phosphate dikinase [Dehalococcoidia bacterium]|nr:pyruvate, phosphate dikinase [Dehalococcoidia bacterium]